MTFEFFVDKTEDYWEVSVNTVHAPDKEHKLSTPLYAIEAIVYIEHTVRQIAGYSPPKITRARESADEMETTRTRTATK